VNGAIAEARFIACSSMEIRIPFDKKSQSTGEAGARNTANDWIGKTADKRRSAAIMRETEYSRDQITLAMATRALAVPIPATAMAALEMAALEMAALGVGAAVRFAKAEAEETAAADVACASTSAVT
jgi:hypothetical protein